MSALEDIKTIIDQHYTYTEYPALADQIHRWGESKPLQGITILDATPIFRNTMVKYMALIAAGARLSVGISSVMPHDPKIVDFLKDIGIEVISANGGQRSFDIILDCAGSFSGFEARLGYVELTRSGVKQYEGCSRPVFVADSGKIKKIETLLGTGESLFRALKSLGHQEWQGKQMVLFGSGKVGRGIILYCTTLGVKVTVVTDLATLPTHLEEKCVNTIDYRDTQRVIDAISDAYIVVTATGQRDAISDPILARTITDSSAILANMGVEDEFGTNVPQERVLNNKKPLNFILEEPTHLKYIETTMSLHNAGALYISNNRDAKGIINPPAQMEQQLLRVTKDNGVIGSELNLIDQA